ncbi:MAG TPA: hypothetical protein PK500_03765 [Candidatus Egerieousia sp.]|nr:hypothetical protein [Candidatus Egerieousia sp.]
MTTHVFIVNSMTFKIHLEYSFVGTGADDKDVDFNGKKKTSLHYQSENLLISMMADGCRMRKGDMVVFYLQASKGIDGKFYGIFQIAHDCIFLQPDSNKYLKNDLKKSLIFRQLIKPYEVYKNGISEWEALDEIKNIQAPCQMLWSLIYRKLRGNRGNTMITIYEAERLFALIRNKNNYTKVPGNYFSFDGNKIIATTSKCKYQGNQIKLNILPRLIQKLVSKQAFEAHLQMYITQNIGRKINRSLDTSLYVNRSNIEWIGNEVSCGLGMQRIDIMISKIKSSTERIIMPIELKAVSASSENVSQITRYIDWIEQYYLPNRQSTIQPVLLCLGGSDLSENVKMSFHNFNDNSNGRYLPLIYIEYVIKEKNLVFKTINY